MAQRETSTRSLEAKMAQRRFFYYETCAVATKMVTIRGRNLAWKRVRIDSGRPNRSP